MVGAGALGNEVIKNLALLGVGSLYVVDLDFIERSNLARCVFFREEDAGLAKASVVARRAMELNPDVSVIPIEGDVRTDVGLGTFVDVDVVIGALDNRDARLHLNECCWKTQTPWVDGAIEAMMGEVRVFTPPDSVDYAATLGEREREELERRRACTLLPPEDSNSAPTGRVPTTATTASVVAGIQVQEAIKLLHGDRFEYQFGGRGFLFNGISHDSYPIEYSQGGAEAPEIYDLGGTEVFGEETTMEELLMRAEEALDGEVHLRLEREILMTMSCSRCDQSQDVRKPAKAVPESELACPSCGLQRRMDLVHRVTRDRPELFGLTPGDLGLPPSDLLAAVDGERKLYFRIGPELQAASRSEESR